MNANILILVVFIAAMEKGRGVPTKGVSFFKI